jgi:hypothetical protein
MEIFSFFCGLLIFFIFSSFVCLFRCFELIYIRLLEYLYLFYPMVGIINLYSLNTKIRYITSLNDVNLSILVDFCENCHYVTYEHRGTDVEGMKKVLNVGKII